MFLQPAIGPNSHPIPIFDGFSASHRPIVRGRRKSGDAAGDSENTTGSNDVPPPYATEPEVQSPACPPFLRITERTYLDIMHELGTRPPEAGGALFGPIDSDLVTHFRLDENAQTTPASFTLDHVGLNQALKKYLGAGIDCKGIVHSHPPFVTAPSQGDLAYVRKCFANERNQGLHVFALPIVCNGRFLPYLITKDDLATPLLAQLVLI